MLLNVLGPLALVVRIETYTPGFIFFDETGSDPLEVVSDAVFPESLALDGSQVGLREVFCFGDVFNGEKGGAAGVDGAGAGDGGGPREHWTSHFGNDGGWSRQSGEKWC